MTFHSKVIKDKKYMKWVCENKPCFICNLEGRFNFAQIQFHHLQGAYRIGAMIRNDAVGLPLCFTCHSIFQKRGERMYWEEIGVDPKIYADELYNEYKENNNDTK
jgi:hypothetical protein